MGDASAFAWVSSDISADSASKTFLFPLRHELPHCHTRYGTDSSVSLLTKRLLIGWLAGWNLQHYVVRSATVVIKPFSNKWRITTTFFMTIIL